MTFVHRWSQRSQLGGLCPVRSALGSLGLRWCRRGVDAKVCAADEADALEAGYLLVVWMLKMAAGHRKEEEAEDQGKLVGVESRVPQTLMCI